MKVNFNMLSSSLHLVKLTAMVLALLPWQSFAAAGYIITDYTNQASLTSTDYFLFQRGTNYYNFLPNPTGTGGVVMSNAPTLNSPAISGTAVGLDTGLTNASSDTITTEIRKVTANTTNYVVQATNDVLATAEAYSQQMTNRPALYVDSSNVLSGILTWAGPSNTVTVYPGFNDWFYASATPVSLTNCVGAVAGYKLTMDLCISNSSAATFTNFCTIPNATYVGQNGLNQGTNALTIASGKQGYWRVETRGVNRTNVYSTVEQ